MATEDDIEYYKSLEKELTSCRRWEWAWILSFALCLGLALEAGPNAGWPWLLGSIATLMLALQVRIDEKTTRVLIQIYWVKMKK